MSDLPENEVVCDSGPIEHQHQHNPEPPVTEARTGEDELTPGSWRRSRTGAARLLMRIAFVYFLLYTYPFPLRLIPDVRAVPQVWNDGETPAEEVNWNLPEWVDSAYQWRNEHSMAWGDWERKVVDRVAADVFGFTETLDRPRASGDPTYGYVETATRAAAAIGVALLWFLIAAIVSRFAHRRDRLVEGIGPWIHLAGRYYLASVILGYGLAKVYPSQFSFPDFARLETPYGDGSPMNILWSFMGSSKAYIIFSGIMEVLPALLLLTRRTALLGALLGAAVMANVAVLNYCYDVPVKLFSTHLFVLAAALAAVDLKPLAFLFLLNRPTPRRDLSRPRTGWLGHAVRLLILVPYVALSVDRVVEKYRHPTEAHELQGIWDVDEFLVDGSERIPRTDDSLRFQALIVDRSTTVHLKAMDSSMRRVTMSRNKRGDRMTIRTRSDWNYSLEGEDLVLLGEHQRTFRADPRQSLSAGERRGPQVELRLRRDPDYVSTKEVRPSRARVPEELRGRWLSVSRERIGDTATRRHRMPYGWDSMEIEADGEVRVQFALSEETFKVRATPDEDPEPKGGAAAPEADAPPSTPEGRLTLSSTSKLEIERTADDRMRLEGKLRGADVEIELFRRDPATFLLVRRGFHWINEIPMNTY